LCRTASTHVYRLYTNLPCNWNVQLGDHSDPERCSGLPQAFHWNSARKQFVVHERAQYFLEQQRIFEEMDGYHLASIPPGLSCGPLASTSPARSMGLGRTWSQRCSVLAHAAAQRRRVFPRALFRPHAATNHDVTLLLQLSIERASRLDSIARLWKGPMSIAVYASDSEFFKVRHRLPLNSVLNKNK
jgi:glycosyltransferase-like protein LARGE